MSHRWSLFSDLHKPKSLAVIDLHAVQTLLKHVNERIFVLVAVKDEKCDDYAGAVYNEATPCRYIEEAV